MTYNITINASFVSGLPTYAGVGVPTYPTSNINWTTWTLSGPTYGLYGGAGHTSPDLSLRGVDGMDDHFKEHDIAYFSGDAAVRHAADIVLIQQLKDLLADPDLALKYHYNDVLYAKAALALFQLKAFDYDTAGPLFPSPLVIFKNDPLVLDLDGDGIELSSLTNSGVHFDYAGDGFAEATGWVSADDGILAIDDNNNGTIDDGLELFGSSTQDGFAVLERLDSNGDGRIDALDVEFEKLLVWRDFDQDGVSDSGELQTLTQAGIASISLNRHEVGETNSGHDVGYEAQFTRANSSTGVAQTIYFATDRQNSVLDNTPAFVPAAGVENLPQLAGSGTISSIAYRATNDLSFRALWTELSDNAASMMPAELRIAMEAALLEWAGVQDINPQSRGPFVDARHLAFIEAFFGDTYREVQRSEEVRTYPGSQFEGDLIEASFEDIFSYLQLQFLTQTAGSTILRGNAESDLVGDSPYLFFFLLDFSPPIPGG